MVQLSYKDGHDAMQGRHTDRLITVCYLPVTLVMLLVMIHFNHHTNLTLRILLGMAGFCCSMIAVPVVSLSQAVCRKTGCTADTHVKTMDLLNGSVLTRATAECMPCSWMPLLRITLPCKPYCCLLYLWGSVMALLKELSLVMSLCCHQSTLRYAPAQLVQYFTCTSCVHQGQAWMPKHVDGHTLVLCAQ